MHYFNFNIKSYVSATVHLTNEEDLAYRRLLEYYYDTESPIPTALPLLCRRLRLALPDVESVLNEFFVLEEDGWHNAYCDEEIKKYHRLIERQRINGSKGGRGNKADSNPNKPTALPENPTAKPTKNKEQRTKNNINTLSGENSPDATSKYQAKKILALLNEKTGRDFREVKSNLTMIEARLKEFSYDDLKVMVETKCNAWLRDEKMSQYLRPSTLFNAKNCASYIGSISITPASKPNQFPTIDGLPFV